MHVYNKLLQHPLWQKKRLKIMERDLWECRSCNATDKMLHVHHTKYIKDNEPWEYDDNYLITLCKDCHETHHDIKTKTKNDVKSKSNDMLICFDKYKNITMNDLTIIHKSILDQFAKTDHFAGLSALYMFYYYTLKWQSLKYNITAIKCTTDYAAKKLGWSKPRVRKYKKILMEMGLVQDVVRKDPNNKYGGWYIKLNYMIKKDTIHKLVLKFDSTIPETELQLL